MTMAVIAEWHTREYDRFLDRTYKHVPVQLDYPVQHFLHLSTTSTETDYVAYTPSDTYGAADRQVRLKFGRYLKKVFPDLTDAEIQAHVTSLKAALATIERPVTLQLATDEATINRIFETEMRACGSSAVSCMYGKFDGDSVRPYHVYANSPDVAVAYVPSADGGIVSRSVVSTKYRKWVRAYSVAGGDNDADCGTLKQLLEDAGYSKGNLTGCRLTKLRSDDVMLPYIDHNGAYVRDDGRYWVVTDREDGADYRADCTDGTASECGERCECCNERPEDCECSVCECCGSRTQYGCDTCRMCEHCDGCIQHDGCNCERCSECHKLVEHYFGCSQCECDRCGLTYDDVRNKLNSIWVYLCEQGDYSYIRQSDAMLIVKRAFDSLTAPSQETAA